jgi:hypothetical protein
MMGMLYVFDYNDHHASCLCTLQSSMFIGRNHFGLSKGDRGIGACAFRKTFMEGKYNDRVYGNAMKHE